MAARGLEHARRLYRARRYREVLSLLEPQIFRFRTDPVYYALLGMSCLYTGEVGGAATYLGRSSQLDDQNTEVLMGLAVVHLKRREPESAVACWLRVLDLDPHNRIARRGLDALRSSGGSVPEEMLDSGAMKAYLPAARRRFPVKLLFILAASLAAAGGAAYGVVRLLGSRQVHRPGIEDVTLPTGSPEIVVPSSEASIIMTEREILRAFSRAKRDLLDYRDNLAVYELNRILLSNASAAVKERARILRAYAEEPDFSTFRDPFAFEAVEHSPREYVDCHVRWSGRVANVAIGEERITLDLLVGYQDGKVLEGVVPVVLDFAAAVENGSSYELLARIVVDDAGTLSLYAVSIRPISSKGGEAK